jgi:threonine aldolase
LFVTLDFRSDNTHGASPEILSALTAASKGSVGSYGADPLTAKVRERCSEIFERNVSIFPLFTGTGGNALAIATMTPPWGAVFAHEDAHVHRDEMGAPEFYSGGAKVIPIAGANGKLEAASLDATIRGIAAEGRMAKPAVVSLTQATEAGTVYGAGEMRELCAVARANGCRVHVDGARFANAVVATGAVPADLSWRAGVDILVFGATKNGAMAAELAVVFDDTLGAELTTRIHRAGQRASKMRFLSAQFDAYLTDQLWLRNARHANAMAQRLAKGVNGEILRPVDANIVFARFPTSTLQTLRDRGALFYDWPLFGEGAVRLVTGFSTSVADVDAFIAATL